MNILLWIILGGVAGWIADVITKSDHGILEDIILGVMGGFIGGIVMTLFQNPGITGFNVYSLFVSAFGAIILIFVGRIFHKSGK